MDLYYKFNWLKKLKKVENLFQPVFSVISIYYYYILYILIYINKYKVERLKENKGIVRGRKGNKKEKKKTAAIFQLFNFCIFGAKN
jgi:hypothetical protein